MSDKLFYMQDSRSYVGNDVLWWARNGCGYTSNLLNAEVYTLEKAQSMHNARESDIPWPKDYIDGKTRPAVDMQYIDKGEGLRGSGVKLVKPKRVRSTTGKARGNCPDCGKITWGYDPHENTYCGDCSINRSFCDSSGAY